MSGFGDLVATCSGNWSRNRSFGARIGEGETARKIIESQKSVVEGYGMCQCVKKICEDKKIDAPIIRAIYSILYEGLSPLTAMNKLMTRNLKNEKNNSHPYRYFFSSLGIK